MDGVDFAARVGLLVGGGLVLRVLGLAAVDLLEAFGVELGLLLDRVVGVAVERRVGWR